MSFPPYQLGSKTSFQNPGLSAAQICVEEDGVFLIFAKASCLPLGVPANGSPCRDPLFSRGVLEEGSYFRGKLSFRKGEIGPHWSLRCTLHVSCRLEELFRSPGQKQTRQLEGRGDHRITETGRAPVILFCFRDVEREIQTWFDGEKPMDWALLETSTLSPNKWASCILSSPLPRSHSMTDKGTEKERGIYPLLTFSVSGPTEVTWINLYYSINGLQ